MAGCCQAAQLHGRKTCSSEQRPDTEAVGQLSARGQDDAEEQELSLSYSPDMNHTLHY